MLMVRRRPVIATVCCALMCAVLARPARAQSARELRDRASDLAYNLDHDEAVRILRQAVSQEPNNPANHRALAATLWLNILFQRNAVTVDNYLGGLSRATVEVKNPPPALDAEFRRESDKAIELAEQRVAAAPRDALAHLDLGSSLGLRATYVASVEGRLMAGFKAARRSYDECEQALALDPGRIEPALVVGTYRYIVSTLSLPMRMMAYVAGFGGGKDKGIRMIEEVAAKPQAENRTDAQFALILLYNREQRYADALRTLADLRREYPRNRLVLLETGATALRAGRAKDAEAALDEGLQMLANDRRPRMPGEEALWHLKRGSARAALKRPADAKADLAIAMRPDSLPWVRGRAHLEAARIALQEGNRATARAEAASAASACGTGNDPVCVEEARKIK